MGTFVTIIHIVACIVLVLVVLLQVGKGADMGSLFGGSSQTIFGSSGPGTFLGKVTAGIAVLFMITSLILSHPSVNRANHKTTTVAPSVNSVMPLTAMPTNQTMQNNQPPVPTAAPEAKR
ncbi:MAG: preprotein translocase subunit SecG [Deltaproteobacteria bacterium]